MSYVVRGSMVLLLVTVICILFAPFFYGIDIFNLQRSSSLEYLYEPYYNTGSQFDYPYSGSYYGYDGRSQKSEWMTKARSLFNR